MCKSDKSSSPNPILVGVTGFLVLFDEIWFPCRSICPSSMRKLDYVKFVDEEYPDIKIDYDLAMKIAQQISPEVTLNMLHSDGYGGFMEAYYGLEGRIDNHTHGLSCFGATLRGSPDNQSFVLDLLILNQLDENFTHALNGLTRNFEFPNGLEWLRDQSKDEAIRLADSALTISSIYELTGPKGPYHPVLEELRTHDFVSSFRRWIRNEASPLHNNSSDMVISEMNEVVQDFERSALRSAIGEGGLKEVSIDLIENIVLDSVPGASSIKKALDLAGQLSNREQRRLNAYIAESRGLIWNAKQENRIHLY